MLTPEHMRTWHGYAVDEVASEVQKCIRRGNEEQAIYWSFEMMESPNNSHYTNLWNRLKVIASEDVGMGQPFMPILNRRALAELEREARSRLHGQRRDRSGSCAEVPHRGQRDQHD